MGVDRAAELVAARRKGCEAMGAKFEAPLKEAVRLLLLLLMLRPAPAPSGFALGTSTSCTHEEPAGMLTVVHALPGRSLHCFLASIVQADSTTW